MCLCASSKILNFIIVAIAVVSTVLYVDCIPANAQNAVNIYTSRQKEFIEPLLDVFTQMTGIKTKVRFIKKGAIAQIVQEGDSSPADLLLVNEFHQLVEAKSSNITQAIILPELQERVDKRFRDPENHWFGLSMRARIILVAKDRVSNSQISYEELAAPDWKGRICIRSLSHPYNVALIASLIAHNGDVWAEKWLRSLKTNLAKKPAGGDRTQAENIYNNKCDVAIINSYYMGAMIENVENPEQNDWAKSVILIFPNKNERGTHVNITGMALLKYAPNKDNAIVLMDFLTSKPAQYIYAIDNHEYPIRNDVNASKLVSSWGKLNPDDISLSDISDKIDVAKKIINDISFDDMTQ